MSSLVTAGPPLSSIDGSAMQQPARLHVKGAAELLLPRCRLAVQLDGSLAPLAAEEAGRLIERAGRDGLRLLALAYTDVLLQPAIGGVGWQLLPNDEAAGQLVLIGLLGLEDPGVFVCMCVVLGFRMCV